ncbi:MAG: NRPS condensation-like uncharacterized protein [Cellvibrionaceae bacterium]|jgi:NRPS condensation-like uncharacterized protein
MNNIKTGNTHMSHSLIPDSFPTVQIDDMFSAFSVACDLKMHWVIKLEGQIDIERIKKAIRLSVDAEPVLGCFLQNGWYKQNWKRCMPEQLDNIFSFKETKNLNRDLMAFKTAPYDAYKDPSLKAVLLRSENDTICIMFSHVALDGGGTKEYFKLLASIYNSLGEEPNYYPKININGSRDLHQVTKSFSFTQRISHLKLVARDYFHSFYPKKSWQYFILGKNKSSNPTYVSHTLNSTLISNLKKNVIKENISLTNLLMASIYRALFTQIAPSPNTPLRLGTTVDLRPHLKRKRGEALCNLSAAFDLNIGEHIGDNLIDTAKIINREMEKHKKNDIGMGDRRYMLYDTNILPYVVAKKLDTLYRIFKFLAGYKKIPPLLAFAGKMDRPLRMFKDVSVTEAYASSPLPNSPIFFICLTGYNGAYTLCSGFKGSEEDETLVKNLFLLVENELSYAVGLASKNEAKEDVATN